MIIDKGNGNIEGVGPARAQGKAKITHRQRGIIQSEMNKIVEMAESAHIRRNYLYKLKIARDYNAAKRAKEINQ
jgi:hypothetical protein